MAFIRILKSFSITSYLGLFFYGAPNLGLLISKIFRLFKILKFFRANWNSKIGIGIFGLLVFCGSAIFQITKFKKCNS